VSPHAEAYFLGTYTQLKSRLIFVPRGGEYLTQEVWDRMAKALSKPVDTSKVILEARRG
jgi:hypothetical protein